MTYNDLFYSPPTLDAFERRDAGIANTVATTSRIDPEWMARAVLVVREYAETHETFLAEDVRKFAHGEPGDGRVWGAVMREAYKKGIVEKAGYDQAKSSNLSPKTKWRSMIYAAE